MIDCSSLALDPKAQTPFWKHLKSRCLIPLVTADGYKDRAAILGALSAELAAGRYTPQPIHGFLSSPKGRGVSRFLPVFHFLDYAVFFACVAALDSALAEEAVEDTFGGFTLGGTRRRKEENWATALCSHEQSTSTSGPDGNDWITDDPIPLADDGYAPVSAYNPFGWVESWRSFWQLASILHRSAPDDSVFVAFDVANFYDTIDLPRLERELRRVCPGVATPVDVLLFLLRNWNREGNLYNPTSKGVPMDIIGDCARVLANFYLTPYDRAMREDAQGRQSRYARYADDMILVCSSAEAATLLIDRACRLLHGLGLNINVAKVQTLSKTEFGQHWGFDILTALSAEGSLFEGLSLMRDVLAAEQNWGRKSTALRLASTKLTACPDRTCWHTWLYNQVTSDPEFIVNLNYRHLFKVCQLSQDHSAGLKAVSEAIFACPYTEPLANLYRCAVNLAADGDIACVEQARRIREALRARKDAVLELLLERVALS